MSKEQQPKPEGEKPEIELEPDAWDRFERFIKTVTKAGPKHRPAKQGAPHGSKKERAKD